MEVFYVLFLYSTLITVLVSFNTIFYPFVGFSWEIRTVNWGICGLNFAPLSHFICYNIEAIKISPIDFYMSEDVINNLLTTIMQSKMQSQEKEAALRDIIRL